MTFWLLGSLAATSIADLIPLFGPVALGTLVLVALRWRMNVMSLPDEEARALGLPTGPLRIAIVAAATLVTSASVATAGIIGWVGLVVPHIARSLVGPDFARLLPAAALLGGGFLLVIDTLARTMAPIEIPLGILTALVGTPFFIWLLASVSRTSVSSSESGRSSTQSGFPHAQRRCDYWMPRFRGARHRGVCFEAGHDPRRPPAHHRLQRPHGRHESRCRAQHRRGAGAARAERRRQDHALKTLLGLLTPKAGEVRLGGRPLRSYSDRERARLVAYVPQVHNATFAFPVETIVLMGRTAHGNLFSRPTANDRAVAARVLERFGIAHLAERPYTMISGGERQLALLARALAQEPQFIVLDEPTASLDFGNQGKVMREIRALAASGHGVLFTTHDPNHAMRAADRAFLLREGTRIGEGPVAQVLNRAQLEALYGAPVEIVTDTATGAGAFLPG